MRIAQHARKWGVTDDAMRHALRRPIARWEQDENRVVIIGPDPTGRLLELAVEGEGETDDPSLPVIVHAMPLRKAWYAALGLS